MTNFSGFNEFSTDTLLRDIYVKTTAKALITQILTQTIYEGKPTHGKEFIIQNVFYLAQRYGIPYSHIDIEFTGDDLERMKQFDTMRILEEHVKKNVNHEYLASRKITPATASELTVYRDWETDRKSTRLNSSHITRSRMPSSA